METISNLRSETVEGLKKLVRMNHDASKGYADAAETISSDGCARLFRTCGADRERFAGELKAALNLGDESVPDGGTALGTFHRCWLNLRGALNGGDEEVVLAEAIRGESALVEAYENVLVDTAGSPLNAVMQQHIKAVREARKDLEGLKEQLK